MEIPHIQGGELGDREEPHRPHHPTSAQEDGAVSPLSSAVMDPVVMSTTVSSPSAKPSTVTRSPAAMHTPVPHGAEVRVHNMVAGFNRQILVQKLSKLNISQQSIETVSHWCVFHHRYCQQVVETWDDEFHSATCERRVSLLYLANDIMQNSRKEGSGYIAEFMRVIPASLDEVFTNGDDFGRNVVKRLVDIWEDRKIFDNQGQNLRDDFFRRLKDLRSKLKKPGGELLEKVIYSYKHMLNATVDEDSLMRKCQAALSIFYNLDKAYANNSYSGGNNGSGFIEELQEQHSILRDTIEQLKMSESLRTALISHLKAALNEQGFKVEQIRNQLQAAQSRYKNAVELCQDLGVEVERHQPSNQELKKSNLCAVPFTVASDSANNGSLQKGQSSVMYSQEGDGGEHNVTATNAATELAVGPASDEILSGALSSQANGSNLAQQIEEHSFGNKRQKLEEDAYMSQPHSQPLPPPFPHPDTFQPPPPEYPPSPQPSPPPPPTSMPSQMMPPPPVTTMPPQLISPLPPTAGAYVPFPSGPPGPVTGMPYVTYPPYTPVANFPMTYMPPGFPGAPNPPPSFQGFGGTFYGTPPYPTAPPPMDKK